jgi:two-component system chemotaxis response regulator CheY
MATVLAVDDSETMRMLVKMALGNNHEVRLAGDGEEGLNKFNDGSSVDMIITDINLPKIDGFEMVRAIRAKNQDIPILALTTESCDAMRKRGEEAGVDGWVTKPLKPQQFADVVARMLEMNAMSAALN